jgi:hypothetical protein
MFHGERRRKRGREALDRPANLHQRPHEQTSRSHATADASLQMGTIAANNIVSYLRGEVYDRANFVNPEVVRRS